MEIVDAQIHATHRGLEQSIAIMDAMGVSAAVLDDWPPTRQKLPSGLSPRRRSGAFGARRLCRPL